MFPRAWLQAQINHYTDRQRKICHFNDLCRVISTSEKRCRLGCAVPTIIYKSVNLIAQLQFSHAVLKMLMKKPMRAAEQVQDSTPNLNISCERLSALRTEKLFIQWRFQSQYCSSALFECGVINILLCTKIHISLMCRAATLLRFWFS